MRRSLLYFCLTFYSIFVFHYSIYFSQSVSQSIPSFQESEVQFSFSVADQRDKGVMGEWDEDDTEMDPQRTVLIVPADKIPTVMGSLQQALSM